MENPLEYFQELPMENSVRITLENLLWVASKIPPQFFSEISIQIPPEILSTVPLKILPKIFSAIPPQIASEIESSEENISWHYSDFFINSLRDKISFAFFFHISFRKALMDSEVLP